MRGAYRLYLYVLTLVARLRAVYWIPLLQVRRGARTCHERPYFGEEHPRSPFGNDLSPAVASHPSGSIRKKPEQEIRRLVQHNATTDFTFLIIQQRASEDITEYDVVDSYLSFT